jgi:endogenous inhibitor of DNA gyrase (YacG/DUF329 family)
MKCLMCERESNERNFVIIEENERVLFCSANCVWIYLKRRFVEEGKVFAGKIEEGI